MSFDDEKLAAVGDLIVRQLGGFAAGFADGEDEFARAVLETEGVEHHLVFRQLLVNAHRHQLTTEIEGVHLQIFQC